MRLIPILLYTCLITGSMHPRLAVANEPPFVGPVIDQTVEVGQLVTFQVTASDDDGDPVTFQMDPPLPGMQLWVMAHPAVVTHPDTTSPHRYQFRWTPTLDHVGTHTLRFTADDGTETTLRTATLTVIDPANLSQPPIVDPLPDQGVMEGALLSFLITAVDPEGEAVTYRIISADPPVTGASLDATGGLFQWIPTAGQAGSYVVAYEASDGADTSVVMHTITVMAQETGTPPVFTIDSPLPNEVFTAD